MMKRYLQGFLLLLVVLSAAAIANDFPNKEESMNQEGLQSNENTEHEKT
jgi:hypothetical protein